MEIVIQDIFLKQMQSIEKRYLIVIKFTIFARKKIRRVEKLICSIEDKEKNVAHIRALKQPLNHGSKLKKVHRVIQLNQKAWLKPHIDKNTDLRKEAKKEFEKDFFKTELFIILFSEKYWKM